MSGGNEVVNAKESSGGTVGLASTIASLGHIVGRYDVECWGPSEEDRQAYIELRDEILALEAIAEGVSPHHLALLRRELAEYPIERKWADVAENVVTTVGKNHTLDNELAGSAYTAAWFLGLISLTGYTTGSVVGDTMASHGGWAEDQNYTQGTRPAPSFSAASGGSKTTSAVVVFSINATTTIKGCFLNTVSTKGGTTGTLYSAGLFTGGDQPAVNGNTLNVTYTSTLT
jgi:hypothetical protein